MGVPNRQIGWSQEASLLQKISRQFETLANVIAGAGSASGMPPLEVDKTNFTAWNNGKGNIVSNTSYGGFSLYRESAGFENTSLGYNNLSSINPGSQNTCVGTYSGLGITGNLNTCVGTYGGAASAFTGSYNTSVGVTNFQGFPVTGSYNTALGAHALRNLSSGNGNTGLGSLSLQSRTGQSVTGSYNISVGYQSFRELRGGSNNIGFLIEFQDGIINGNRNINLNPRNKPGAGNNNDNVVISGIDGTLPVADGQVYIGNGTTGLRFTFNTLGEMTINIAPTNGTGVSTEKVMILDTVSDANGMASVKTVDYIDTNATTTALSLATLNSTYPGASVGFRVICMSVSGGALIYTKTGSTSWCSNTATATA